MLKEIRLLAFVILLVHHSAWTQQTIDDLLAGMNMRDSMIESLEVSFSASNSFPDAPQKSLYPESYTYKYKDNLCYMDDHREDVHGTHRMEASFNGRYYTHIAHSSREASIYRIPPWASQTSLKAFFAAGLGDVDDLPLGKWFSERSSKLVESKQIEGHTAHVISDGGKENPEEPNGEGYEACIVPDFGFAPSRVTLYRRGAIHKIFEFHDFEKTSESNLWKPKSATIWTLDLDEKQISFTTASDVSSTAAWLAGVEEAVATTSGVYNGNGSSCCVYEKRKTKPTPARQKTESTIDLLLYILRFSIPLSSENISCIS